MIGRTIGPYNIVEILGKGGMGVVYKAIHSTLEQQVAIKALSTELSGNPSSRKRFVKEAKIQAKFSHPNVVNIFNYLEDGEDVFIVMEYVNGQTLEQKLKSEGAISEKDAISISIPVLEALDFMHSNGVVHRDIKPSNIMITNTGLVKVTDFGIAKIVDEKTQQTKTGMVGSLYYISPEQILGEKTSAATDVYSYGVTLFHMITGKALYEGTEYAIMRSHLEGKPVSPWEVNDNVSKNLGKVVLKAIQKAPKDRYKTAKAFSDDLKKVESGASISIPMPRIIKNNQARLKKSNFSNKRAIYGGIGLFLLLSIIALAFNREPEQKTSPPVTANSSIDNDIKETKMDQAELPQTKPAPKAVATTNIKQTGSRPVQVNDEIEEDERFTLFDEDLYNEKNAKEIEERNKKLEEKNKKLEEKLREEQKRYEEQARVEQKRYERYEEKLREEQKRYREKAREARKREEEIERKQEKKQKKLTLNHYKKVYNPVKNKVFHPIKKGFIKLKKKVR